MPPVEQRPLPSSGPLPPAVGAAGTLEGPDAAAFWQMAGVGRIDSLAVGDGVLVVCGEAGVSGYDLGSNPKWRSSQAFGVPGSGNGVVAGGVVYLIVSAVQGSDVGGVELLALDLKTGEQKWRVPALPSGGTGMRIGGAFSETVFVAGTAGGLPFLWAVSASDGRSLWQKTGVEFATLAVPSAGDQILTAGAADPNSQGSYMAVNIGSGAQVWSRPLRTSIDYGHVSLSKAAYAGDRYVLLGGLNGDSLFGGLADGGQTTWSTALPEPDGDAGSLAFVTSTPDGNAVVALSHHGVYAADASSGAILWRSQGTQSFDTASDVGAPQFADGNVYLYDQQGTWWAVDFATGRTRWKYSFARFEQGTEPVWSAVPGGVVVSADGGIVMIAANG
jgi:outer membrane protein assembly factor BamB